MVELNWGSRMGNGAHLWRKSLGSLSNRRFLLQVSLTTISPFFQTLLTSFLTTLMLINLHWLTNSPPPTFQNPWPQSPLVHFLTTFLRCFYKTMDNRKKNLCKILTPLPFSSQTLTSNRNPYQRCSRFLTQNLNFKTLWCLQCSKSNNMPTSWWALQKAIYWNVGSWRIKEWSGCCWLFKRGCLNILKTGWRWQSGPNSSIKRGKKIGRSSNENIKNSKKIN